jgi:micrococcal nuclease
MKLSLLSILIISISLLPACKNPFSPEIKLISHLIYSPNPCMLTENNFTTISYALSKDATVRIQVFNANGKEVVTLFEGPEGSGNHYHNWDGKDNDGNIVDSGSYIYMVKANDEEERWTIVIEKLPAVGREECEELIENEIANLNSDGEEEYNYMIKATKKVKFKSEESKLYFILGHIYSIKEKHKEAVRWFRGAKQIEPYNAFILYSLSRAYRGIGNYLNESLTYRRATRINYNVAIDWYNFQERKSPASGTTTRMKYWSQAYPTIAQVKRVIDGDTIELDNGEKVRYIGINTPETKHPIKGIEYYGLEAYFFNMLLVEGKMVILKYDIQKRDKYGRLLAYVFLLDGTFVNAVLVKEGYAQVSTYPPNVKYQNLFLKLQREARENARGLWKGPYY